MKKRKIYLSCNSNLELLIEKANTILEDFGNKGCEIIDVDITVDKVSLITGKKPVHVLLIHYEEKKPEVTPRAEL